jgi:N-acetylmuramoyl-L-alanine amidase
MKLKYKKLPGFGKAMITIGIGFFLFWLVPGSQLSCEKVEPKKEKSVPEALPFTALGFAQEDLTKIVYPRKAGVSNIMLHSTNHYSKKKYLELSLKEGMLVQLLIDKQGTVYGFPNPEDFITIAAPLLDEVTIHLALEGYPGQIAKNRKQFSRVVEIIAGLAKKFQIPLTNWDITSKKGIFTHTQAKYKFGGFIRLYPEDGGEKLISMILKKLKGKYYPEEKWKDRYKGNWVYRKESNELYKERGQLSKGRGLTPLPKAELKCVEQSTDGFLPEKFRVKYVGRGKIKPSCIVMHFSGSRSFYNTRNDLENRKLISTFIGDTSGKIYQIMDSLDDRPAAANGTNKNCLQIEIVGIGESDLLKNQRQMRGVAGLLKEVSAKFNFPLNNLDIASFKGVFSHGQAKKKWGQSVWIGGGDFDPGENYMKKIIELAGGKYFPESKWQERTSLEWKILYRKFQP